jgi:PAS domain S-box-containing protein
LAGGFRPGLLALGLSLFYDLYFLVPPSLLVQDHHSLLALAAFAAVGVSVCAIVAILRRKQSALAESEQRLRATFDNAGVGVGEEDAQGCLVAVNDRLCEILGRSREELLRMTVQELTAPEDQPRSAELHAQLREARLERFESDKCYVRGDGSLLWAHVTVSAIRDSTGRYLRAIGTVETRHAAESHVQDSIVPESIHTVSEQVSPEAGTARLKHA